MSDASYYDDLEEESGGRSAALPAQLRDPMGVLRRQLKLILILLVPLLALTALVTLNYPLRYQAVATMSLTAKSIPDEYVPTTVIANILEQFETIRAEVFSRDSLSSIIVETNLYAKERENTELSVLALRLGRELSVAPISPRSLARGAPQSVAFAVTLTGDEPQKTAEVVNATVAKMINANVEYRSRQARITTRFMQREFDRADEALNEHQRKLAQFRSEHRGALPEEQNAVTSKLERLEEQRRSAILRISDHESRLSLARARPGNTVNDGDTLASLQIRLQNARAVYTDEHPLVQSLERQVAEYDRAAAAEITGVAAAARAEIRQIQEGIALEQKRLAQIDDEVRQLEERVDVAPAVAEEYDALLRKDQILRENYIEYLRKLKNAELALSLESAQQGAQLTRLDSALPPTKPVFPRWIIACAGLVASLGIALAIGILRELLMAVVIDEGHLETLVPLPVIGSIPDAT